MEITTKMEGYLSDDAKVAVENNQGNNAIGGSFDVVVGDKLTLGKIDFRSAFMAPRGMKASDWDKLSDDERESQGRKSEWYIIETDKGDMPLSMLLRTHQGVKPKDGKVESAFCPKTRKPLQFIADEYGDLFGKVIDCIASADETNERFASTVKHRWFKVESK